MAAKAAAQTRKRIAIIGGPGDRARADELHEALHGSQPISLVNAFKLPELAALARVTTLLIGPDTGVLHLMAAAGAPTVMIFGPSDPRRYAPFVPPDRAAYAWRPYPLPEGGVASGPPKDWTWEERRRQRAGSVGGSETAAGLDISPTPSYTTNYERMDALERSDGHDVQRAVPAGTRGPHLAPVARVCLTPLQRDPRLDTSTACLAGGFLLSFRRQPG